MPLNLCKSYIYSMYYIELGLDLNLKLDSDFIFVGGGDVAIAGVAHMTSVQTEYHILLGRDEQW